MDDTQKPKAMLVLLHDDGLIGLAVPYRLLLSIGQYEDKYYCDAATRPIALEMMATNGHVFKPHVSREDAARVMDEFMCFCSEVGLNG